MMITRLLATIAIAGTMASSSTIPPIIDEPQNSAPDTYDLVVDWRYNLSAGWDLWAYTPNGGGIFQPVRFTRDTNYYISYVASSFFATDFTWTLRIPRGDNNDALFALVEGTTFKYLGADTNSGFGWYRWGSVRCFMSVSVVNSDYVVKSKRDINTTYSGTMYYDSSQEIIITSIGTSLFLYSYHTNKTYNTWSSFSVSTSNYYDAGVADGALHPYTNGFYFELVEVVNIEDEERQEILAEGYKQGWDDGRGQGDQEGYNRGLIDGQEGAGWNDVFAIFSTAIDTVGDVMEITLFGPFTIGALVAIPIVMGLLFWIIEKWRGS